MKEFDPHLAIIQNIIEKGLERIPSDAEYEDFGEGSMRYAFLTWIEETLKIDGNEWLLEFAEV